jgi:serine/threonine-protein kinase
MGVVYKAFDTLMHREVAVKTLRDVASSVFVDLFYRECSVLSAMVHPNIVEIFDMGEFEEDGVLKPYFVMPLLPGRTLYDLIYSNGKPLPVERCTDIISQACRGLHAAHECGLLHRDIKPRNIFVMRDDAIKLIDFGVVRLMGSQTIGVPGTLGTLHYMAPEQISMKPLTARSDIFSLATVCYEALTGVHPFVRDNESETAAAVTEHTPSLICALNPLVNRPLAQAVAQAMAKDPRNRFESAAAFADALQRGLRNELSGATLLSNPQDRLARAQRSFARGDYEFTEEILDQLEAEGVDGAEVPELRVRLDEAVSKRQTELHLATARRYFQQEEYLLALRHVSEALDTDPSHQDALSLKNDIEDKLNELHVAESLARAIVHLDSGGFAEARRLIEDSLQLQPNNAEAQRLLKQAGQRALDWPVQKQQQEELFQSAQSAYFEGRFDTSLRTLEHLAELTRHSKAAGARVTEYNDFYRRARDDYDALQGMLADARKLLANGDFDSALVLSERLRERCPQDPDVRALSKDIAARRDERQKLQSQLQQITELVQRAQAYESSSQFDYALEEWLCVGDVYPAYPGLQEQLARVKEAWKATREKAKAELSSAVTQAVKLGDHVHAAALLQAAQPDFHGDADYLQLETLVQTSAHAHQETAALLSRIRAAESEGRFGDIPKLCQVTASLSQNVDPLSQTSFNALLATASRLVGGNWRVAEQVLQETAKLGTVPVELHEAIRRQERDEEVGGILCEDRAGAANLDAYRERVAAVLAKYPGETRLEERLRFIDAALGDQRRDDEKRSCAAQLTLLYQELDDANDHGRLCDIYTHAKNLAAPFAGDPEIAQHVAAIREQSSLFEEAAEALSRDRIKDCFAICDSMLARCPGHRLFQKMRDQADARHRELADAYFARVERWLAGEPDIYQRESILQKAQEEYPFETRFSEELRQLQREKAMVESLAAKARDLAKRGQMAEALVQWRQLRNLDSTYPGLEEQIANCESSIDRQQRKVRAQRLLSQGESHLADGHFAQGYQMVYEASTLSQDIPGLLRLAAPNLVVAARAALPSNSELAEAMANLAQALDDSLRLPKELRGKINEARKAEDMAECLRAIQARHQTADLVGALAVADQFLAKFPAVRQVESVRSRLLREIEQENKQRARAQALDQFREMELGAAGMGPTELLHLKQNVQELAALNPGDEEVRQRASTLDSLFSALAEVRGLLLAHALSRVDEACARALEKFPAHPLFKAALAEAAKQKVEVAAQYIEGVKQRLEAEHDFEKKSAILRDALARYPADRYLLDQLATLSAKQNQLNAQIEKARSLEGKHLFGEAIRAWEALAKDYPWYSAVPAEVERISNARRKEKQDAHDRWFRQVEDAIEGGDHDTASTMIRQAAQQQPDRKLQGLEEKLRLKKKQDSDAKLKEGSNLLADGNLVEGGKALYRAYELQPKDEQKTNAIALLLLGQIRANMPSDITGCEVLLSHLNRIRPGQTLPRDIREAMAKKQQASSVNREGTQTTMDQLADLARQAENARSRMALSSLSETLQASRLLESSDPEVRRAAAGLLRKINLSLSGLESSVKRKKRKPSSSGSRLGSVVAAAILLICLVGITFFLLHPGQRAVPLQFSVTPDGATIELNGRTCVAPECKFKLKPGEYNVILRKSGYRPKSLVVTVKSGESTPLSVTAVLDPLTGPEFVPARDTGGAGATFAKIEIHGALPRTRVRLDGSEVGVVAEDGAFRVNVAPGPHTLDLSLDGFSNRTITREFAGGEIVSLAKEAVQLEPR